MTMQAIIMMLMLMLMLLLMLLMMIMMRKSMESRKRLTVVDTLMDFTARCEIPRLPSLRNQIETRW